MENSKLHISLLINFTVGSELGEGVTECPHFVVDVSQKFLNLSLGVQKLNRLCVRVIADSERSGDGRSKVDHALLCVFEALRNKVDGLMLGYRVFLQPGDFRIKLLQLRLS